MFPEDCSQYYNLSYPSDELSTGQTAKTIGNGFSESRRLYGTIVLGEEEEKRIRPIGLIDLFER